VVNSAGRDSKFYTARRSLPSFLDTRHRIGRATNG